MNLRFDAIWERAPDIAVSLWNTVWICSLGTALSLLLGILLLIALMSRQKFVCYGVQILVEGARAIPFLMLAYMVYYGLPSLGITLNEWHTAILTIVIYNSAYVADILRTAWLNLPTGQIEAGRAYGFTGFKLLRSIVLPQLLLAAAPVLGNQFIQVIRDSSFLALITVPELTFTAKVIQSEAFVPFESYLTAAVLYWILCLAVELGIKQLESARKFYAR